jgi:hypothetical protein
VAVDVPLLLALDDTEFDAGGLCAAVSVQAAMRFWLHGHNGLPAHERRRTLFESAMCGVLPTKASSYVMQRSAEGGRTPAPSKDATAVALRRNAEAGRFAAGDGSLLTAVAAALEQWRAAHVVSPKKQVSTSVMHSHIHHHNAGKACSQHRISPPQDASRD